MRNKDKQYYPVRQNPLYIQYYKTPIGELILGAYNQKLCLLDFRYRSMRSVVDRRIQQGLNASFVEKETPFLRKVKRQLDEYLAGDRRQFDLPLLLVGTDFQKKVWKALMRVAYGTTATYLDIARRIGHDQAVRAVAQANGANAIGIIIPCHRIIGRDGGLVGYGGGVRVKKYLLNLERDSV